MESTSPNNIDLAEVGADSVESPPVAYSTRYGIKMLSAKAATISYVPDAENMPFVLYAINDTAETVEVKNVQEVAPWSKGKKALYMRADTSPERIQELRAKGCIVYPKRLV